MVLKVYEGVDEVLVFPVDADGQGIGEEAYFDDRDRDDYDVSLVEPPLMISTRIKCEPERVLTR